MKLGAGESGRHGRVNMIKKIARNKEKCTFTGKSSCFQRCCSEIYGKVEYQGRECEAKLLMEKPEGEHQEVGLLSVSSICLGWPDFILLGLLLKVPLSLSMAGNQAHGFCSSIRSKPSIAVTIQAYTFNPMNQTFYIGLLRYLFTTQ